MVRYLGAAGSVALAVVLVTAPFVGPEATRGIQLAALVALAVQAVSFALLAAASPGTGRYLSVWLGSTLVRFVVIVGFGFAIAEVEGVDLVASLLALAGLFFVMLLLEPWALRERADDHGKQVKIRE
jgi:hypothetical protein